MTMQSSTRAWQLLLKSLATSSSKQQPCIAKTELTSTARSITPASFSMQSQPVNYLSTSSTNCDPSSKIIGRANYVKSSQFLVDHQTASATLASAAEVDAESEATQGRSKSALELVGPELHDMFIEIHSELDKEIQHNQAELSTLAK